MKFTLLCKTSADRKGTLEGKKHVLLTFDNNYYLQTLNLMHSIVKHNDGIGFICLCPSLDAKIRDILFKEAPDVPILLYEYGIDFDLKSSFWPNVTCFRCFAPWLIDEPCVEYCVYMDSDILCSGNIERLFSERNMVCMCNEISGNSSTFHEQEIGAGIYCNAGVMGISLKLIREAYSYEQMLAVFQENVSNYPFLDQDFCNIFFRDRLTIWNGLLYDFQAYELKGSYFYKDCLKNCKLIHFAGAKPWSVNAPLFLIRLYKKYTFYGPMLQTLAWLPLKRLLCYPFFVLNVVCSHIKCKINLG